MCFELISFFDSENEFLSFLCDDGGNDVSAVFELVYEWFGKLGGTSGDNNCIEGGFFWQAVISVAYYSMNVGEFKLEESFPSLAGKSFDSFDGPDFVCEVGEDSGLIARSGADFENFFMTF